MNAKNLIVRANSKDHLLVPFLSELGKVSDGVISEKTGVSRKLVGDFRFRNGIASKDPRGRKRKPSEDRAIVEPAVVVERDTSATFAWKISVGDRTFVVVSPTEPEIKVEKLSILL